MLLIEKIKADQIEARKSKIALTSTLLTTLIGEATAVAKNNMREQPTDDEVKEVITRFLKGNRDLIEALNKSRPSEATLIRLGDAEKEKSILESYMPKKLSKEELMKVLSGAIADGVEKSVGPLMGFLKKNYLNLYDGREASQLIQTLIV